MYIIFSFHIKVIIMVIMMVKLFYYLQILVKLLMIQMLIIQTKFIIYLLFFHKNIPIVLSFLLNISLTFYVIVNNHNIQYDFLIMLILLYLRRIYQVLLQFLQEIKKIHSFLDIIKELFYNHLLFLINNHGLLLTIYNLILIIIIIFISIFYEIQVNLKLIFLNHMYILKFIF